MKGSRWLEDGSRVSYARAPLLVEDVVRYLLRLASLEQDPRTGNVELSDGLHELVGVLKRYSQLPITELAAAVTKPGRKKEESNPGKRVKLELPSNLESLSAEGIERILANRGFTKLQLIDLGAQRFGISRSRLLRLGRDQVVDAVQAAVNHEKSIEIISEEARRGGVKRSS